MRRIAILPAVLTLLVMAGCASDTTRRQQPGDTSSVVTAPSDTSATSEDPTSPGNDNVTVLAKGFSTFKPPYGSPSLGYGVLIRNPNPARWIATVAINVTFADRSGNPVKTQSETLDALLPGETAAVGDTIADISRTVTAMEVQALATNWQTTEEQVGSFQASKVQTVTQQYGGLRTNARVSSTFAKDLKDTKAVAIYYNAAGKIIGGAWTFVDFIPAGRSAAVEITASDTIPRVTHTKVFMQLTNLSALG